MLPNVFQHWTSVVDKRAACQSSTISRTGTDVPALARNVVVSGCGSSLSFHSTLVNKPSRWRRMRYNSKHRYASGCLFWQNCAPPYRRPASICASNILRFELMDTFRRQPLDIWRQALSPCVTCYLDDIDQHSFCKYVRRRTVTVCGFDLPVCSAEWR